MLLLVTLATGTVIGYLRGGRLRHLARVPLAAVALVWVAFVAQAALSFAPADLSGVPLRYVIVSASYVLVAIWIAMALRTGASSLPLVLIGTGWLANSIVMAANGGMPVSLRAARAVGRPTDVESGGFYKHVPASADTTLGWLGDMIPVAALHAVVSVGDLFLAAGIALFIALAMKPAAPRFEPPAPTGSPAP